MENIGVDIDGATGSADKTILLDAKDENLYIRPTTLYQIAAKAYLIMSETKKTARLGKITFR